MKHFTSDIHNLLAVIDFYVLLRLWKSFGEVVIITAASNWQVFGMGMYPAIDDEIWWTEYLFQSLYFYMKL